MAEAQGPTTACMILNTKDIYNMKRKMDTHPRALGLSADHTTREAGVVCRQAAGPGADGLSAPSQPTMLPSDLYGPGVTSWEAPDAGEAPATAIPPPTGP